MTDPAFVAEVPVRWVDLDAQGHVNNALVADYLQEARVAYLLNGPNAHLLGNGIMVVGHQLEYRRPINFTGEPVSVRLWLGNLTAARFTIAYEVVQDGEVAARARTNLCLFDFEAGRPRRLTAAERQGFAADAGPLEPMRHLERWEPGPAAFEHPFVVRWSDLDAYGHVNNVRFFDFVAEARIHMGTESDPAANRMSAASAGGYLWMVARQDIDYLAQLEHRLAPYTARVSVAHVGRTSMTLVAHLVDPGSSTVSARATTVLVCGDAQGRPIPIPAAVAAGLHRWPAVRPSGR